MESPRPMDRLICGDVGYGKTEVAIRAAFKAVQDGKQVAVLAPTTILVEQHRHTFDERLADYPVRVRALSRFRSRGKQEEILSELAAGTLDIVIGTHRLLQKDVEFHDLGLLVVDEEQRFGVRHKERLKQLRTSVDVLTLTATPIPRTLYLSLSGIRDLTLIRTPPRDRMPIITHVLRWSPRIVQEALQRELDRGGQAFFLHNRVETIATAAERVRRLAPDAEVAVAHGQMNGGDLDEVMRAFVDGELDVLVCTSIIENGLDVPNANTLIVDRADRFGLAQLYQIRGRVGRSDRRA
ncbi:MAG: DEAD/DEAH box helicase, partial [Gemmatimonadetes bacterium]|nr:DEAD/DEAH box helicase [Gemmatimonadota bacterium]NIR81280.1 DEAD/DEAH box helicase [Gemmatimonadota bacterium]NIT90115.1 DEAD/DEAH box helicase [Gemmatimonadota bacterium]NIU33942.1 DEAD/DEAH box helicase [Gemmatimonadota bacterium]NIU38121.1 DEAD/DEAH box helicase [Gemmatimonadota bacterium]